MKILNFLILALLISTTACAKSQKDGYTMFYNHYNDMDGIITFKIPGAFANMFLEEEEDEAKEFIEKMDKISFLIADYIDKDMILDLNNSVPEKRYKTMMEIREGKTEIQFFAREDGTIISEILMTVIEENNLVVMCIYGKFTMQDAKKIAKSINTESAVKIRS